MKKTLKRIIASRLESSVVRLLKNNPDLIVIGVAGSVGKTTTKLAIANILEQHYRVNVDEGNYNSDIGLPLSLFGLKVPDKIIDVFGWFKLLSQIDESLSRPYPYDVAVIELGTDHPGEIAHFMRYLSPDIGVLTLIAPEHMENFKTIEAVAEEELKLLDGSRKVLINSQDSRIVNHLKTLGDKPRLTYGKGGEVHWIDDNTIKLGEDGATIKVTPNIIGDHSRLTLLAAACVALELKMTPSQIKAGIDAFRPVAGRMQLLPGINDSYIIDDSYNSSPNAVVAALETLDKFAKSRKIALLGQMNEMGEYSVSAHIQAGKAAVGLDVLLTLGKDANNILGPAAIENVLDPSKWHQFSSPYDAGDWLKENIHSKDTILFKGSQDNCYTEEAIKSILFDPSDHTKLVRQSPYWLDRKSRQFGGSTAISQTPKRVTQQSIQTQIGEYKANRSCSPVCFYMLAKAGGYLGSDDGVELLTFIDNLDWENNFSEELGWIRPKLASELRSEYGMNIVCWQLNGNIDPDISKMKSSGYIQTSFEEEFFLKNIVGKDLQAIISNNYPVMVGVKPGFGGESNSNHAIIITSWDSSGVVVIDPDDRNSQKHYTEEYIDKYLNPTGGGCTIVIPKN